MYKYTAVRRGGFLGRPKKAVEGTRPLGVLSEGQEIPLSLPGAPYDELGSARLSGGILQIKPGKRASIAYTPEGFIDLVGKGGPLRSGESHVGSVLTRGDAGVYRQAGNGTIDWGNGIVMRRVAERA